MPMAIGGGNKDFQLAVTGAICSVPEDGKSAMKVADTALKAYFKVNPGWDVGVEFAHLSYKLDSKAYYSEKGTAKLDKNHGLSVKIGSSYKISDTTSAKAKVTFADKGKPQLDLALTNKFGSSAFNLATKIQGEGAPEVAFGYKLE